MGAWIEIARKYYPYLDWLKVAPLVGAWIEIIQVKKCPLIKRVAPLVGAWIEILFARSAPGLPWSLPSWERGLKSLSSHSPVLALCVAPLVGAWIEILVLLLLSISN